MSLGRVLTRRRAVQTEQSCRRASAWTLQSLRATWWKDEGRRWCGRWHRLGGIERQRRAAQRQRTETQAASEWSICGRAASAQKSSPTSARKLHDTAQRQVTRVAFIKLLGTLVHSGRRLQACTGRGEGQASMKFESRVIRSEAAVVRKREERESAKFGDCEGVEVGVKEKHVSGSVSEQRRESAKPDHSFRQERPFIIFMPRSTMQPGTEFNIILALHRCIDDSLIVPGEANPCAAELRQFSLLVEGSIDIRPTNQDAAQPSTKQLMRNSSAYGKVGRHASRIGSASVIA